VRDAPHDEDLTAGINKWPKFVQQWKRHNEAAAYKNEKSLFLAFSK
jgi:hypothetical protein